jgi:nitrate reductase NapAB chaperone NapD
MRYGGVLLRVRPGRSDYVAARIEQIDGVEVVQRTADGLALVVGASSPAEQERRHREIAAWPEVVEASVVFQSSEV